MASPSPRPPSNGGAGNGGKASLADWKSGAVKMTTASAGEHVAKTAPKPKPKPKAKVSKPAVASTKPWAEQSIAERYGTQPRNTNLVKQLKDVLKYLEAVQERGCISWEEIITQGIPPWYDIAEGGELYNLLMSNARVLATSNGFAYQSEHGISDKTTLLGHIRAHPEGVKSTEIKDGYESVLEDADKLQAEGVVYKIYNAEFKMDVFFPVPQKFFHPIWVDLAETYLKTQLPPEPKDLEAAVTGMSMRSALAMASRDRKAPMTGPKQERPKKKRKLNLRHITNTHMAHMLTDNQYTSID